MQLQGKVNLQAVDAVNDGRFDEARMNCYHTRNAGAVTGIATRLQSHWQSLCFVKIKSLADARLSLDMAGGVTLNADQLFGRFAGK